MNKEKLMQLLSKAIDKEADIRIHFSQYHNDENRNPVTSKEAEEMIHLFADALNISDIRHDVGSPHADSFIISTEDFRVTCSYIPNQEEKAEGKRKRIEKLKKELAYLEEDVDLSGGVDHAV